MYKNLINKHLSKIFLKEDKPNGLNSTEKVQNDEKKVNKDYYKDVEKKMKDYTDASIKKDKSSIEPVKVNIKGDEKTYHDEMEIRNGQEMLKYDNKPSDKFKERAEMALKGDSKMGNKTYTGDDNGNTEEVWGSSGGKNTGEEIIKQAKSSSKKRNDAEYNLIQLGDDIEDSNDKNTRGKSRKIAVENKANNNKPLNETKMKKRLRFKKSFDGLGNALQLIPESYKVDLKEFEMTDGNETYSIRWEGTLSEGKAVVLSAADKSMVNEDIQKMKHLMGYKSENTLGVLKGEQRLDENNTFRSIMDKTKSLLTESDVPANPEDYTKQPGYIGVSDDDDNIDESAELEENEDVTESLLDEGWRDFLGMEKSDVIQQREEEFNDILQKAEDKGIRVNREILTKQGKENKFRGKLVVVKGTLIYKAAASGLGQIGGAAGGFTSGQ